MSLRAERNARGRSGSGDDPGEGKQKRPPLRKVVPEIWTLIKPRRWLLALGFVLMVINRVSGLVLPASTKFLVDNVLVKHQAEKLPWIVGIVLLATAIQAITSFSLTQLLSKAAQRLIADLRMQVQQHIGRLSVSFYDSNRTGVLVSRIMTDVEGVRNLIGTGPGRLCWRPADRGPRVLYPDAHQRSNYPDLLCLCAYLCVRAAQGLCGDPAYLPGAGAHQRRGQRAADRIPWRRGAWSRAITRKIAKPASLPRVWNGSIRTLSRSLTATSLLSLAATAILGIVGAIVMWLGARQEMVHKITPRRLLHLHHVSGVHGCAGFPGGEYRHPTHRGHCRP